mgnify:FL=1
MNIRTDLAIEVRELHPENIDGVENEEIKRGSITISKITVTNETGAKALGKPVGKYITADIPPLSEDSGFDSEAAQVLSEELESLLPKDGSVLVTGLGNNDITPDALGPKAASHVLATRHITGETAKLAGLDNLRKVAVLSPGVLGQTGIETGEIIAGIAAKINPSAVIVIDALASHRLKRLGCTVQMTDTGISPGSGVGNNRKEISKSTLGIPVIAIGVPTVVEASTLAYDITGSEPDNERLSEIEPRGTKMIVTPREIDTLISRASALISHAINCALQKSLSPDDLMMLVS